MKQDNKNGFPTDKYRNRANTDGFLVDKYRNRATTGSCPYHRKDGLEPLLIEPIAGAIHLTKFCIHFIFYINKFKGKDVKVIKG